MDLTGAVPAARVSWLGTLGLAVLTAGAGAVAMVLLASLWSSWYRWSTFEGAAGYAVVGWGLLGLVGGALVGAVAARTVGAGGAHPFARALGASLAAVAGVAGTLGVAGRALADVAPELDGDPVLLVVEARWPAAQLARPPAGAGSALVRLGRFTSRGPQAVATGLLWTEELRRDPDGRWVVPGAVLVPTGRGRRLVELVLDEAREAATTHGFLIPLPDTPGSADRAWSAWMPHPRPGAAPLPDGFQLRYRVQRSTQPLRTMPAAGPFTVRATVSDFQQRGTGDGRNVWDPVGGYELRYRDRALPMAWPADEATAATAGPTRPATAVAVIAGPRPALLVAEGVGEGSIALVTDDGARARSTFVAHVVSRPTVYPMAELLGAGPPRAVRSAALRLDRVDREALAAPGPFLVGDAVLDTRTLAVRRLPPNAAVTVAPGAAPLALSPDGVGVVRYAETVDAVDRSAKGRPVLAVADAGTGRTAAVPIDRARMRYADPDDLTPAWVAHHFTWTARAGGGYDLAARAAFTPLPYGGRVGEDSPGYPMYTLPPSAEGLRGALVAFLVAEMGGERLAPSDGGYTQRVRVAGRVAGVSYDADQRAVHLMLEGDRDDAGLVRRVAAGFDRALAEGRYDGLFAP